MPKKRTYVAAGVLLIAVLVFSSAAEAAGAFDIEITGPGLERPAVLRWDDMAKAVVDEAVRNGRDSNGFNPFFLDAQRPLGLLGPRYQFKVSSFIPSEPPKPLGIEHWSYYPRSGLVLLPRSSLPSGGTPWREPVPALASLFNQAIPGRQPIVTDNLGPLVPSAVWEWVAIGGFGLLVLASLRFTFRRVMSHAPYN